MKHLIKVFAFVMFFSTTITFAQNPETKDKEPEKKTEKIEKIEEDQRVYAIEKKHLATKVTAEQKIAALDMDDDGKISIDEASASENKSYLKHFATIDLNGDGFIDVAELKVKMDKKKKDKEQ